VPVFLAGGDKDDITRRDGYLFFIRSHYTFALGNDEYLFRAMAVKLVSYPAAEVYLTYGEILAQLCADNRLSRDRAGKQGVYLRLLNYLGYFDYFHGCLLPWRKR
jgi:hypothetical protein